ncbi:hypothetical protein DL738_11735 [Escherichia coli]|nr:hypothetical protein [Escherichia coli]
MIWSGDAVPGVKCPQPEEKRGDATLLTPLALHTSNIEAKFPAYRPGVAGRQGRILSRNHEFSASAGDLLQAVPRGAT